MKGVLIENDIIIHMPMSQSFSMPRYSAAGEAAKREQERNAALDRIERNKKFPTIFVKGFGFRPYFTGHETIQINGPLCPAFLTKAKQCLAPLTPEGIQSLKANCQVCGKNFTLPHPYQDFMSVAHRAWEGHQNSEVELINLDIPFEAIKAEKQDETRSVKVVWSQKDGRNQAIIYFIEKDSTGNKTHIFADFDKEEVRYDSTDIPPGRILAKIKAEFKNSTSDIAYKES
jgi:hypothetical protein